MVATRRTSLRLQEKATSSDCSLAPASDDNLTPTRARKAAGGDSASKKSPRTGSASKAKTPPKRGAKTPESESVKLEKQATETEDSARVKDEVTKELFQDEKPSSAIAALEHSSAVVEQEANEATESDATGDDERDAAEPQSAAESTEDEAPVETATSTTTEMDVSAPTPVVESQSSVAAAVEVAGSTQDAGNEVEGEEEEEEEVIIMMDSDEDEAVEEENTAAATAGDDDDNEEEEEEDIAAYVMLAASGLNLSASKPAAPVSAPSATPRRTELVPDTLDSGASQYTAYFEFQGHAKGATFVPEQRAKEEQATVRAQLHVAGHAQRQRAEHENKKSAGRKWFDMESQELTADARRDFALLRMRNYLDPKKFYKTSDHHKKLPKHFQMGVVVEGAHEFKSARLTKKERQQTFTDEIMADAGIQQYTKRVFGQIQASRSGQGKKKMVKKKARY
ncbi:hypothetical protein PybrP1_010841 [[Pythium] brassicae (nom. inval.)]|nr:hypothetical protein PybrP1_010841 [[Pythium] brassicae (nom. inval.)]